MNRLRTGTGFLILLLGLFGCGGTFLRPVDVHRPPLIGLTQERLHACAEPPIREASQPASLMLVYYREASMFEESFGSGKGSKPGYHHGCWATVLVEEGRVTGVEFQPVPHAEADNHECQEIFAMCVP
jgi:hypothetical protein